jgi:hypothetical protein
MIRKPFEAMVAISKVAKSFALAEVSGKSVFPVNISLIFFKGR